MNVKERRNEKKYIPLENTYVVDVCNYFFQPYFSFPYFFVSNEHKTKEEGKEEEEEEEQGEVEEDNDEEDEGDEVELLLACNNISARFIANSSYLHSNSPHHFLLQTQEVESVVVEVFSRVLSV